MGLKEFQANPPPQRRPAAPAPQPQQFSGFPALQQQPQQQQRFQPQPQRPAPQPQQQPRFQPQPQPQPQQFAPAPQRQRRPQAQAPRQEPGSVNDELGQQVIDAEQYVHDPTGDATLSRFQLFQQRKKLEAQGGVASA